MDRQVAGGPAFGEQAGEAPGAAAKELALAVEGSAEPGIEFTLEPGQLGGGQGVFDDQDAVFGQQGQGGVRVEAGVDPGQFGGGGLGDVALDDGHGTALLD